MAFIFIQTAYVSHLFDGELHANDIFNTFEFFNEGMIILMCYIMICYTGIGDSQLIIQS